MCFRGYNFRDFKKNDSIPLHGSDSCAFYPHGVGNSKLMSYPCIPLSVHPHRCGELLHRQNDRGDPFIPTDVGYTADCLCVLLLFSVPLPVLGEHFPQGRALIQRSIHSHVCRELCMPFDYHPASKTFRRSNTGKKYSDKRRRIGDRNQSFSIAEKTYSRSKEG